jgi:predicted nucleic acid-binding protein
MIYLDTNIFIYPHTGDDAKSDVCISILQKATSQEIKAGTSILTWDEFQHVLKKEYPEKEKYKAIEQSKDLLTNSGIVWFEATKEIIEKAQELTEKYNIKPRDAIHAATAILNGCTEVISDDSDFDKIKEIKRKKL